MRIITPFILVLSLLAMCSCAPKKAPAPKEQPPAKALERPTEQPAAPLAEQPAAPSTSKPMATFSDYRPLGTMTAKYRLKGPDGPVDMERETMIYVLPLADGGAGSVVALCKTGMPGGLEVESLIPEDVLENGTVSIGGRDYVTFLESGYDDLESPLALMLKKHGIEPMDFHLARTFLRVRDGGMQSLTRMDRIPRRAYGIFKYQGADAPAVGELVRLFDQSCMDLMDSPGTFSTNWPFE